MEALIKYKKVLFAFGIALIALSFILVLNRQENVLKEEVSLWVQEEKVLVFEVVDSPRERVLGLSGREKLADGVGMLFVFDTPDIHGIWMKDMLISIDIVWLDEKFRVVNFKENVSPDTYPTAFTPASPALYVIEANVGFVEQFDVKIGEILEIKKQAIEK